MSEERETGGEAPEPRHEALARRRGEGFVATCTCGWYGHDVRDRREATRAALEHEMRAAQKLARPRRAPAVLESGGAAEGGDPARPHGKSS